MLTSERKDWSTGELGDHLNVQGWRISRLFKLGVLPEPSRVAGRRLIRGEDVPAIVEALRDRGWLPEEPIDED